MRIETNPDREYSDEIKKQIKKNGGYCISATARNKHTKCMCTEFLESEEEGVCSCGRYIKYKD